MSNIAPLLAARQPFLTDGGMETWLFFQQGFTAPEFAAIALMDDQAAREALESYFDRFLELAERAGTGFVLDTNSWRGGVGWAPSLGISAEEMLRLGREAVRFARSIRARWEDRVHPILIEGTVGPAGDGYGPGTLATAADAEALHAHQIRAMAEEGIDIVAGITITNVPEATGIVRAAKAVGLPAVISFTVETDGRLPSGDLLGEAIEAVDAATGSYPAYYMVNCAHPDHFRGALAAGEEWLSRIGGVRANASRLSHAELDEAEELDEGDPDEFGRLYGELARLLPNLKVVGGCCGTDFRHVGCVSRELHLAPAG